MPKNTNILLIRHAEKPDKDTDKMLAVPGRERAHAYIAYFQGYAIKGKAIKLNTIIAAANSNSSHRPMLTILPTANALNIAPDARYKDADYAKLANEINADAGGIYDNSNILICWHHGQLPKLAVKLGMPKGVVPDPWPSTVFGWVVQMCFDANGNLSSGTVISQQLMYDDYGQAPPPAMSPLLPTQPTKPAGLKH